MVDGGRGLRFLNEAAPSALIGHELRWQDLHRDFAIEPGIEGPIHDSHTAPAELFLNPVMGARPPDHDAEKSRACTETKSNARRRAGTEVTRERSLDPTKSPRPRKRRGEGRPSAAPCFRSETGRSASGRRDLDGDRVRQRREERERARRASPACLGMPSDSARTDREIREASISRSST